MTPAPNPYYELWATRKPRPKLTDDPAPTASASIHVPDPSNPDDDASANPKSAKEKYASLTTTPYQVRLDAPDGITYAPDALDAHNAARRLFVPYRSDASGLPIDDDDDDDDDEDVPDYDYLGEILTMHARRGAKSARDDQKTKPRGAAGGAFDIGHLDEDDEDVDLRGRDDSEAALVEAAERYLNMAGPSMTTAQKYAASLSLEASEAPLQGRDARFKTQEELMKEREHRVNKRASTFAPTLAPSQFSTRSSSSHVTTATSLAAQRGADGFLPANSRSHISVASTKLPPSVVGRTADARTPWTSEARESYRSFDRPTPRDIERGATLYEEISGEGRPPSLRERGSVVAAHHDGGSRRRRRRVGMTDVFIPDPRPWRPLRYVRRTDPSQLLLVISGVCKKTSELNSMAAARAAAQAGIKPEELANDATKLQALLASADGKGKRSTTSVVGSSGGMGGSDESDRRGGVGFVYCPQLAPGVARAEDLVDAAEGGRREANVSRRLERTPDLERLSRRRAVLRSALACLEYRDWEQEGFDKIVVATREAWLVRGISNDIWRWRFNDWTLDAGTTLGQPGAPVPDRDLWQLLDAAVRRFEDIDVGVRFWHVAGESSREGRRKGVDGEKHHDDDDAADHDDGLAKRGADEALLSLADSLAEQGAAKQAQHAAIVKWRKPLRRATSGGGADAR